MNIKSIKLTTISIIFTLTVFNCSKDTKKTLETYNPYDDRYESIADSIVNILTLEEKIALFHGNSFFSSTGIERLGLSELKYTDGPLGIREEVSRDSWEPAGWNNDSALLFPGGGALAATWNTDLAEEYGTAMGQEARARDKDILLAPAINIIRTPLCGRNYEYLSEDPFLVRMMAAPIVIGAQKQDIGVCIKHYAINNQETRRTDVNSIASERTIREIYLPGYKATINAGAYSVMGAYNKFRGHSLCENEYMLKTILKEEWGFKGIVISDWNAVHSTIKSAVNGLDIEMGSGDKYDEYYMATPLINAVKDGKVSMEVIDEKAKRIVRVMLNLKKDKQDRKKGSINTEKHSQTLYKVATEAIVLLKNQNNVLPLDTEKIKSIAVIGENAIRKHATGGFGAGVKAKYEVTPLDAIQRKLGGQIKIQFSQGYKEQYIEEPGIRKFMQEIDHTPQQKLIHEAVELAKSSDVAIVVVGSTRDVESESFDRKSLQLPFGQDALIKAVCEVNPNTVVVIVAGAPFNLNQVKKSSPAVLWSWFNGSEAGNALVDVITGKVNPSGKLPFTIPVKLDDSPPHALNAFPGNDSVVYKEGIYVGYRWFDKENIEPEYCFGYGLSYTQFEYNNVDINKSLFKEDEIVIVSVDIKNAGKYDGKEIIQAYISKTNSEIDRPKKELKAFKKINLNTGETKTISLQIPVSEFAYFNEENMNWEIEKGQYKILLGTSSREIHKRVIMAIE